MALDQYIESKKDATKFNDTITHYIAKAVLAAQEAIGCDRYKLKEGTEEEQKVCQKQCADTLFGQLKQDIVDFFGIGTTDESKISQIINGVTA